MKNEVDFGAYLDEEPSSAPSSFGEVDFSSYVDKDEEVDFSSYLNEEPKPKSFMEHVKAKANKAADWWVNNRDSSTAKNVAEAVSPITDYPDTLAKTSDKYLTQMKDSLNTDITPSGSPIADVGNRAMAGLGLVGGAAGYVLAPAEAAVNTFFAKPLSKAIDPKQEWTNPDQTAEFLTAGASLHPALNVVKGSKATKAVEEAAPAVRGEPILDSEYNAFLEAGAKDEAMGKLALEARQPFKSTVEPSTRSLQEIQTEINQVAADTSIPGAKERLSALQAEKATIDGTVVEPTIISQHVQKTVSKQRESELAATAKEALNAGNKADEVAQTLDEVLAQSIPDEAYRAEIVSRIVPPVYKQADEFADQAAKDLGVDPSVTRGIIDVDVPDDGAMLVPMELPTGNGVPIINVDDYVEPIKLKGKFRSIVTDSTNMMALIARQLETRKGANLGSKSLNELSDFTAVRNMSQQGNAYAKALIGNPNGQDVGVLKFADNGSELVADETIDNFSASIVKAKQMGLTADDMSQVSRIYDEYDNYANIDRILDSSYKRIEKLQEVGDKASKKTIRELKATIKEFKKKTSVMSREEVAQGIEKYQDNEAAQYFLNNKNAINKRLLMEQVKVGKISKAEAERLLLAHPNYVPAWRTVEDFTYSQFEVINGAGSSQPYKMRKISDKGEVQDPIRSMANNMANTMRSIEQTRFRTGALNYFLKNTTDADWAVMFRENKADVQRAINEIREGNKQKWGAEEITKGDKTKVQKLGNIVYDVEGGQLQLTVLDKELFQEFSKPSTITSGNKLYRGMSQLAHFTRSFIVLNPEFPIRNLQRETMDAAVAAKTSFWSKLSSPVTNVKNVFAKDTNPELYKRITDNIGYANTRGVNVGREKFTAEIDAPSFDGRAASQKVEQADIGGLMMQVAEGTYKEGAIGKGVQKLENLANRFDMAPRITVYQWTYKDGIAQGLSHEKAHEAAIFSARNLGVNFTQRGTATQFDKLIHVVPFARSFVNATDRMVQLGRYEPLRMSRNVFMLYGAYATTMQYNQQFKDTDGTPYIDKLDPNIKKDVLPIYGPWSTGVNDYYPMPLGWTWGRALPKIDTTLAYMTQEMGSKIHASIEASIPEILEGNPDTKKLSGKEVFAAWTDYTTGLVSPASMLPPAVNQAVALGMNQDYMGRPIIPEYLRDDPSYAQYTDNTPQVLVDFAYALKQHNIDLNPAATEYLLNSVFAKAATYSLQGADLIWAASSGREAPEIEGRAIPGKSIVSGNLSDVPREGIEVQFSNVGKYLKDIQAQRDAIEEQIKINPNAINDLQDFEIENAEALAYAAEYRNVTKALKPNRDMSKSIAKARPDDLQGHQTPEQELFGDPKKREGMNTLRKNSIEVMRGFLNKIKDDKDADGIWYERLTRSTGTKLFEDLADPKKVDKNSEEEYNTPMDANTVTVVEPLSNEFVVRAEELPAKRKSVFDLVEDKPKDKPKSVFDFMDTPQNMPFKKQEAKTSIFETVKTGPAKKRSVLEIMVPNIAKKVEMSKEKIFAKVLLEEGGYVNHKNDKGGPTKFGVTLETLRKVKPNATIADVKALTQDRALAIYDSLYWTGGKVDTIPPKLQDVVFDGNINHGISGMAKVVQRALNDLGVKVDVDGKMGSSTLNALHQIPADILRKAILARRDSLYNHLIKTDPTQKVFEKGWKKRISALQPMPSDSDLA